MSCSAFSAVQTSPPDVQHAFGTSAVLPVNAVLVEAASRLGTEEIKAFVSSSRILSAPIFPVVRQKRNACEDAHHPVCRRNSLHDIVQPTSTTL